MVKKFLGLVLLAVMLVGCFVNAPEDNIGDVEISDEVSLDNSGIRGTVKIPGMSSAENCAVIIEKQSDGTRTATVLNNIYRSGSDIFAEDIKSVKTDIDGKFASV